MNAGVLCAVNPEYSHHSFVLVERSRTFWELCGVGRLRSVFCDGKSNSRRAILRSATSLRIDLST